MAQKKITDLQLIAAIVDGLNFPSDDGIQSYRATALQLLEYILAAGNVELASLDPAIFHGLTGVSAADDDYFILNDTSDANKIKKALVSSFARNTYTAISGATNISAAGTYKMSGASATITLPTAVGFLGRVKIIHAGTSLSQIYTMATTSGQTIGGIASGSYVLYTNREVLEIESDGANWVILNTFTKTSIATEAITIGAVTTAPSKGNSGSPPIDRVEWHRDGQYLKAIYRYKQTNSTGAAAGSGHYLFSLPAGLQADSTYIPFSTQSSIDHVDNYPCIVGQGGAWDGGPSTKRPVFAIMYNATQFRHMFNPVAATPAWQASGSSTLNQTSHSWVVDVKVPIAGWQP